MNNATAKYWRGSPIRSEDDFGNPIGDAFVDGKTRVGQWAIMSLKSWRIHGSGRYGTGHGQLYRKTETGRWLKVEG